MNQVTKTIAIGAGLYLAYELVRKQIAGGTLLFTTDKIHSFKLVGATPVLTFGMRVQNTSNQDFVINSFAAQLTADNYTIGNVSFFTQQVIPANSQRILYVEARLMLIGIVNDLLRAFDTKDFQFDVRIDGYANVSGLQIPVNLKYQLGL